MPWLITLIFLIRPSIIQSQGMARLQSRERERKRDPARSPPDPWHIQSWPDTQPCTNQIVRASVSVSTRTSIESWRPSVEWIMRHCSISVSVSLSALHFEWPLATLGRTVCRTSKSNYPYKYWTLSAIVDETLWLVSIWFMRSCRKGKKPKRYGSLLANDNAIPFT